MRGALCIIMLARAAFAGAAEDAVTIRFYSPGTGCRSAAQPEWVVKTTGVCTAPPVDGWPHIIVHNCSGNTQNSPGYTTGFVHSTLYSDDACSNEVPLCDGHEDECAQQTHYGHYPMHYSARMGNPADPPGAVEWIFKNPDFDKHFDNAGCEPYHWGDHHLLGCNDVQNLVKVHLNNVSYSYIAQCHAPATSPQVSYHRQFPVAPPVPPTGAPAPPPPPHERCAGESANLTASDCANWQQVYDIFNGDDWRGNAGVPKDNQGCKRTDPCACQFGDCQVNIDMACSDDGTHITSLAWTDNYKDNSHNIRVDNCSAQATKDACLAYTPPEGEKCGDRPPRCYWNSYHLQCTACSIQLNQHDLPHALADFPALSGLRISNTHGASGELPLLGGRTQPELSGVDTDSSGIYGPAPLLNYSLATHCEMMLGTCPLPPGGEHCCGGGIIGMSCGCGCETCAAGASLCKLNKTSMRLACFPDEPSPLTPGRNCCTEFHNSFHGSPPGSPAYDAAEKRFCPDAARP